MIHHNDAPDQFATVRDAARILKISRFTAYRLIQQGHIPVARLGKTLRIPMSYLTRLAATGSQPAD